MTTTPIDPGQPIAPDLECLAVDGPQELQRLLESIRDSGDGEILGTLESLTVTVMTSIE